MELEPVGNYAVRIKFDDLHDTGIYSWNYLYQLGVEHEKRWREYLDALLANGLSRTSRDTGSHYSGSPRTRRGRSPAIPIASRIKQAFERRETIDHGEPDRRERVGPGEANSRTVC